MIDIVFNSSLSSGGGGGGCCDWQRLERLWNFEVHTPETLMGKRKSGGDGDASTNPPSSSSLESSSPENEEESAFTRIQNDAIRVRLELFRDVVLKKQHNATP